MKTPAIFLIILVLLASSCIENQEQIPREANLRTLSAEEQELSGACSLFAIDLFHQLNDEQEPNQFFSPYSIHQALSMTMNGNENPVLQEYIKTLRYDNLSVDEANRGSRDLRQFLTQVDPKVDLTIANAIWYKEGYQVKAPFKSIANDFYDAEIAPLPMHDPNSVKVINDWVEKKTRGMIRDILDMIPPNAVMYLVNAIHYKADWKYQFDSKKTKKEPFYPSPNSPIQVDMMDLDKAATFRVYGENGYRYLEIPYSTGQYNMAILYNESGDLNQAAAALTFDNYKKWKEESQEANFILKMPKFKMGYKIDNLADDLSAMGLVTPFGFHEDNFTELFDNPTDLLKISRVIHDALIEVDEKGSEAAAATVVEIVELSSSGSSTPRVLTLDKPFIFMIQEKHSGAILFMGKLGDPSKL
ncbi:Serine protease inhibitor (serpin family) [Indibacter alkaliphilus LW1]|uniref:Serine protease inhibitor (Serpin family) n=1 Tax=Indibacter alkaliphilus (strain CCUG 57479 / KCTC 22604 / LW1) TaxID=1189612 RepID=S2D1G9_INDAL|nr:serpin family protein [Indibacter alkaliphilus]EOZ93192.1 Serine protease inhibitor (serpin family) [Indibacter alkaliphilus LW1]